MNDNLPSNNIESSQLMGFRVSQDSLAAVRELIKKDELSEEEFTDVYNTLSKCPQLLNNLKLDEVNRLSDLGFNLSRFTSELAISNLRVFLVKFTVDQSKRISNYISRLDKVESILYDRLDDPEQSKYMSVDILLDIIAQIQSSITSAISNITSLTQDENVMNLINELTIVNNNINVPSEESARQSVTSTDCFTPNARKKVTKLFSNLVDELSKSPDIQDVIDVTDYSSNQDS